MGLTLVPERGKPVKLGDEPKTLNLFPEAVRLMRLRHRLVKYLSNEGLMSTQESLDIQEELVNIELSLYETTREKSNSR